MVETKCSKCDSKDDSPLLVGYHYESDKNSRIIDENKVKVKKIENYVTVCKNCGEVTTITQSDNPSEIGEVNVYELTKKSKTDTGVRKFIPNNLTDFLDR